MKIRRVSAAVFVKPERRAGVSRAARRQRVVRAFVDALLGGDFHAAERRCSPNVLMRALDPDTGIRVEAEGVAAVLRLTRRRAELMGPLTHYEVLGTLSSEERVAVIFSPTAAQDGTPIGGERLFLYTVTGGLVSHIQQYEGPTE